MDDDLQVGVLGGQPRDQSGVVVMMMGQQDVADVAQVDADGPEPGLQRLLVVGVTGIDEQVALFGRST